MTESASQMVCPDCGTDISAEPWAFGLCLQCLAELARDDTSLEAELLDDADAVPTVGFDSETMQAGSGALTAGEIHGERYRIRSRLGRGGMGEVWRAYDLKLRMDVALKSLRTELVQDSQALEMLRQEVKVAREVVSANVCRVFDLQELEGQELVSMEYIDGTTLQEILEQRGPLELDEAREIASQFLAGLEAIHDAGLVHRDIKPENIMMTRTGRAVVMDFGIAKGLQEGKDGLIAGTPAYMSPEQSKGADLDSRSDVFSAGVVLAEMVEPAGVGSHDQRRALWERLHRDSPEVAEIPWAPVITKSVAHNPEERYATPAALARALEEVTLRAAGGEDVRPYPGLTSFTEEDAEYFFGRELEVEEVWKKLRRPHLLALIGPSGVGKSSFLRAGLLATMPEGWRAVVAQPGSRPFSSLAQALAAELGDGADLVQEFLRFEEEEVAVALFRRWRERHTHGLVILDQFEELFTQNPQEVQARFTDLLGSLPLEADVHVLLSMRDDFLFHCHAFRALKPLFSELTPLGTLAGNSLRRALVQPALKCGYKFEDDRLVDEMVGEVADERGALPMLAFAAARLWEHRDREAGLLTRESYEHIGGVAGALAQHAETTLERIGRDREPFVREVFRNLVTAQGTRAARDHNELLSVFSGEERETVDEVLNALVDARLLVSFEAEAEPGVEPDE